MKKEYIFPEIEVVELKAQHQLLAGSFSGDPTNPTPGDAGGAAAPEFDFEF
jgi:hypothetical protein